MQLSSPLLAAPLAFFAPAAAELAAKDEKQSAAQALIHWRDIANAACHPIENGRSIDVKRDR